MITRVKNRRLWVYVVSSWRVDHIRAWGDAGTGQWGNGVNLEGSVTPIQVAGYNGPVTVASVVDPSTIQKGNHDGIHFTAENENIITAMLSLTP